MRKLQLSDEEATLLASYTYTVIEREDCLDYMEGEIVEVDPTLRAKIRLSAYSSGKVTLVLDLQE